MSDEKSVSTTQDLLQWAYRTGFDEGMNYQVQQYTARSNANLRTDKRELEQKVMKLAEDTKKLMEENEHVRVEAGKQAAALVTEIEELKSKLEKITRRK